MSNTTPILVMAQLVGGGVQMRKLQPPTPGSSGNDQVITTKLPVYGVLAPMGAFAYDSINNMLHLTTTLEKQIHLITIGKHNTINVEHTVATDMMPNETGLMLHDGVTPVVATCTSHFPAPEGFLMSAAPTIYVYASKDGAHSWIECRMKGEINPLRCTNSNWIRLFSVGGTGDSSYIYATFALDDGSGDHFPTVIRLASIAPAQFHSLTSDNDSILWTVRDLPGVQTSCAPSIVVAAGDTQTRAHIFYAWGSKAYYITLEVGADGWIKIPAVITPREIPVPSAPVVSTDEWFDGLSGKTVISAVEVNGMICVAVTSSPLFDAYWLLSGTLKDGEIDSWCRGDVVLPLVRSEPCAYSLLAVPSDFFDFDHAATGG